MPKYEDMPQGIVEGAEDLAPAEVSDYSAMMGVAPMQPAGFLGHKGTIEKELDGIMAAIRAFHIKSPDQVMRECSAYTARITELEVLCHRHQSLDRAYVQVRTQQLERILAELERQWKTASRMVELMRQDIQLSGGMP